MNTCSLTAVAVISMFFFLLLLGFLVSSSSLIYFTSLLTSFEKHNLFCILLGYGHAQSQVEIGKDANDFKLA
jgi:hypothetical protein